MGDQQEDISSQFQIAMEDEDIPKIYANGFLSGISQGDITIMFQLNGKPVSILNLSYTVAKTLSAKLGGMIEIIESQMGNTIMVMDDLKLATEKPVD